MQTIKVKYVGKSSILHKHPGFVSKRGRGLIIPGDEIDMNFEVWEKELKTHSDWELVNGGKTEKKEKKIKEEEK